MPTILKLGGAVVDQESTLEALVDAWNERPDTVASWSIIHGGGPQLDEALRAIQGPPVKVGGLRVTTPEGAQAAVQVLDKIGNSLATALQSRGLPAVHLAAGRRLFRAITKRVPDGDLQRVGTPLSVDVQAIATLVPPGTIAVVTPIGWDAEGPLNINADEAASALAGSLQAARLVLATDVDHVLDDKGEAVQALNAESAQKLLDNGAAKGGMIPKLKSALEAIDHGTSEVVIGRPEAAWRGQGTRLRAQNDLPVAWNEAMMQNYGTPPITLVRGHGSRVWDRLDQSYIDLLGGIAVNILGHAHPEVTRAAKQQLDTLAHTSNLYAHMPGLELANRLRTITPDHKVCYSNSGTEANEAALKVVRRHAHQTGRPNGVVLAFEDGFHGRSAGALAVTGKPAYKERLGPLPGQVVHVPFNDEAALEAAFEAHDVIAVFAEAVQGEGGVVPMLPSTAKCLNGLVKAHDALLVLDEVQTGVGRTGAFFAHERLDLDPDIITLAKGIAGGLPLGVTLVRHSLVPLLGPGSHGSTFGGNPVSCAAANAVLCAIDDEQLLHHAARKGRLIETVLDEAGLPHRGVGLLQAIPHDEPARIVDAAREAGVLVGSAGKAIRLAPALNVPDGVLIEGLQRLVTVLEQDRSELQTPETCPPR